MGWFKLSAWCQGRPMERLHAIVRSSQSPVTPYTIHSLSTVLQSTILHYSALHCMALQPLHCSQYRASTALVVLWPLASLPALHTPGQHIECIAHCSPLHCTPLHYTTLHYNAIHYTTLHQTTLHYTNLNIVQEPVTLHYTTLNIV